MEQLFYLNHSQFEVGDTSLAYQFANFLVRENQDIDTITFLVLQQMQYQPFLGEMGFTRQHIKSHGFAANGIKIQIHTIKTYKPSYVFSSEPNRELLIAVGVPPKELVRFVDKSRVKYWIIVPWLLEENMSFLRIHEAINFETGHQLSMEYIMDRRLIGAIEWLKDTSNPNQGYHHPYDEDRLKSMANAIRHYNIPFEHDALIHYCIHHGMLYDSALKTVEYFEKAKHRRFHVEQGFTPQVLLNQMNRSDRQTHT